MSMESAKAFFERLKSDEYFSKRVYEYNTKESLLEYILSAGYDFTQEEFNQVNDELSDGELDNVSGFFWFWVHALWYCLFANIIGFLNYAIVYPNSISYLIQAISLYFFIVSPQTICHQRKANRHAYP